MRIESNVLCTSEMAERHTGTNTGSRIQEVLEVWNIQNSHVSAVVTDNASNMTAALNSLEWILPILLTKDWMLTA